MMEVDGVTSIGRITILEHTADGLVEVEAKGLSSLLATAGAAMFDLMCDRRMVKGEETIEIEACGEDELSLLIAWLKELIFAYSTRGMYFSAFQVRVERDDGGFKVRGRAFGELVDAKRHYSSGEVKMLTYHQMDLTKLAGGKLRARLLFDM